MPRIPIVAVHSIEYHRLSNTPFFQAFLPIHAWFHHTALRLVLCCWVQVGSKPCACPPPRRFPPPWSVEEWDACYVVPDHNGQALAYVYFEDEPGVTVAP
jgi:hypothetical protein